MTTLPSTQRTAFIHVGTHKTGTTSIQSMLARNEAAFRAAGVFVPKTGRLDPAFAGHHNVAWELGSNPQFNVRFGTFETLLQEIADAGAPTVCLTSEELEFLQNNPEALLRLHDGLCRIGYTPKIIVYLRPQADYLESLYAEVARAWDIDFTTFLEAIATDGIFGCSQFDYERLLRGFADVFGRANVLARAYRGSVPAADLLREFTAIVAPTVDPAHLHFPSRLNAMRTFADVIESRERHLGCRVPHSLIREQSFDPLSLIDILRLTLRFQASNERVARAYGVHIVPVTLATLARETMTEVFRDRDSRYRKQLIRALVTVEDEVAA